MDQETQRIFILVIAIISLLVVLTTVFVVLRIQRNRKLKQQSSTGDIGNLDEDVLVSFTEQGKQFTHILHPAANKQPSWFSLNTSCNCGGAFTIKQETGTERFFKSLSINRELQTGDSFFDDAHYIISEDTEFTRSVLMDSRNRFAIDTLIQMGFTHVTVNPDQIQAVIDPFQAEKGLSKEQILEAARHLNELSGNLPGSTSAPQKYQHRIAPHRANPFQGPWTGKRIFFYVLPLLLQTLGTTLLIFGMAEYPPLDGWNLFFKSLPFSIALMVLFSWQAIRILRGRSTSHNDVIIVLTFALISFPMAGAGSALFFNGYLDQSRVEQWLQPVLSKHYTTNKNSKTYYLVVKSWRDQAYSEKIRVDHNTWGSAIAGQSALNIDARKGYYDYDWVAGYELMNQ